MAMVCEEVEEDADGGCEACDNPDTADRICEGCSCCQDCCNCTRSDCDCEYCSDWRAGMDEDNARDDD